VCNIIIGSRNEEQLRNNLGAIDWRLTKEQIEKLDAVSHRRPTYPYWHQAGFEQLVPQPVKW
jgi:aryl-alcohol dehydrogenase-like predicted oxidoreductase